MAESRLLEPKALARIARMELVARQAVEGFLAGKHPSPYHGSSVEYADHRPYTLGDEIRTIDWKLLAKTDKYYVKLFEEQTNLRCTILLDTSKSMGFSGNGAMTKLEYGSYLAAALSYLMLRQNDAVGLATFDSELRHYLPARATASHFRRMIEVMQGLKARSGTRIGRVLHPLAGRLRRRGLVVAVTDLLDDPTETINALGHFRYRHHEVIVFHIIDEAELTFPYERLTRFKDAEGTGMVVANPRVMRKRYLKRFNAFLEQMKHSCSERGISYELAQTSRPYDQMLSAYLERRARLGRALKA